MAVIVSVLGHNIDMDDADFCPPCLLRHPFCVCKDNERTEVAVYPHSVPLQFCSKRCHALDVSDNCVPPIENYPCDVDKLPPDVRGLWYSLPLCDNCEELMNTVLVNRFEVAVVLFPQDGVGYVFSDNLGDPLCDPFLDADCCEAKDVLSVVFFLGVTVFCDLRIDSAVIGADEIGGRS